MGHIYKIFEKDTNEILYIGQTRQTLAKRYSSHKTDKNGVLYQCFQKFGHVNLLIESLEETENLNEREKYYIKNLNPIYNKSKGGIGSTWWSEDRKQIASEKMSGPNNPGKNKTEETCKKLSEACKGKIISEETRMKTSETMKGVPKSEETRKRMSEARTGFAMPKGAESKKAIKVNQLCKTSKEFIKTFDSIADAANELGIQRSGIVMCCKGRLDSSGGFSWAYFKK
jgi:hypothetical protein